MPPPVDNADALDGPRRSVLSLGHHAMKNRSYCGRQNADGATRCHECGTSFVIETAQGLSKKAKIVIWLTAGPLVAIPLVFFLLQLWLAYIAAGSSAPNQGAMVLAFLIFVVFIVVGIVSFILGLMLYLQHRSSHEH